MEQQATLRSARKRQRARGTLASFVNRLRAARIQRHGAPRCQRALPRARSHLKSIRIRSGQFRSGQFFDRENEEKAEGRENPTPGGSRTPDSTPGSTFSLETLQLSSVQFSSVVQSDNCVNRLEAARIQHHEAPGCRNARERQRAPRNASERPITLILPHQTHLGTENA